MTIYQQIKWDTFGEINDIWISEGKEDDNQRYRNIRNNHATFQDRINNKQQHFKELTCNELWAMIKPIKFIIDREMPKVYIDNDLMEEL